MTRNFNDFTLPNAGLHGNFALEVLASLPLTEAKVGRMIRVTGVDGIYLCIAVDMWLLLGSASFSTPKIAYVQSDGNDGTAAIGNPGRPYLTPQAAYTAAAAAAGVGNGHIIYFGVGNFGTITLAADWDANVAIAGTGRQTSFLSSIVASGPGININLTDAGDKSLAIAQIGSAGTPLADATFINCVLGVAAGIDTVEVDGTVDIRGCSIPAIVSSAGVDPIYVYGTDFYVINGGGTITLENSSWPLGVGQSPADEIGIDGLVAGTPSSNRIRTIV